MIELRFDANRLTYYVTDGEYTFPIFLQKKRIYLVGDELITNHFNRKIIELLAEPDRDF
jgi:hypothetical protein